MAHPEERSVHVRLVLVDSPRGVDFGVQRGSGNDYETLLVQQRTRGDVVFEFPMTVRNNRKDGLPNFLGPFSQGPATDRFVYIDVGTYAGQKNTEWSRRMKVPLRGITWRQVEQALEPGLVIRARVPGADKDGAPNCATVKLIGAAPASVEQRA